QCPPADLATCRANPAAKGCPQWPAPPAAGAASVAAPAGKASLRTQRSFRLESAHRASPRPPEDDCWNYYDVNNIEIVFRNRATFDYIVAHGFWYVEGIETQFETGFVYDFPTDSVEVKTNWLPLSEAQVAAGRFYTQVMQNPATGKNQTYGLAAMH